jgi:molybdopterin/thiamine biosynthesis adenylyltransferase
MTIPVEAVTTELVNSPNPNHFAHLRFTEADNPLLAQAAWRTHARGYLDAGFILPDAIDETTGWLPEDIDKTRGANTDYYLAIDPQKSNEDYDATMRKVNLAPGISYKDLPAYGLCENGLSAFGKAQLAQLHAEGVNIKEIGGLAGRSPMAIYEVIRTAIHDALGKNEAWLFSIVSTTHESLTRNWGSEALTVIGEDTLLDDPRVRKNLYLRPAMLYPDTFNDTLLKAYMEAESPRDRARLQRSFMFFTDGLDESQMSYRVLQARQDILVAHQLNANQEGATIGQENANRTAADALELSLAERAGQPSVWSEPTQFDLSKDTDRAALVRSLEAGEVTTVVDGADALANELFELKHPDQKNNTELRQQFVEDIKSQGAKFGRWFLFHWSGQLVRYPEEGDHRALRTSRNKNLITEAEQQRLYDAAIFVGGLSVGSNVVRELVSSGIGGTLILSDPDHISPSNLNRINGGLPDVGRSKIDHAAIQISEADPYIRQVHMRGGVSRENIQQLLEHRPSIIFDEVDDMGAKVVLREFAKKERTPLVMVTDVGEQSIVDIERHDLGDTRPFNGRISSHVLERLSNGSATPQEVRKAMVDIVGLSNVSTKMLRSFMEVGKTLPGVPQLGSTASKGGALAAAVAREIILSRKVSTGRHTDSTRKTLGLVREGGIIDRVRTIVRLIKSSKQAA